MLLECLASLPVFGAAAVFGMFLEHLGGRDHSSTLVLVRARAGIQRSRVSLGWVTTTVMVVVMGLLCLSPYLVYVRPPILCARPSNAVVPSSSVRARAAKSEGWRITTRRRISGGSSSSGSQDSHSVGFRGARFVDSWRAECPQHFGAEQPHLPLFWGVIFVAMPPRCPARIGVGQRLFVLYGEQGM